jgi:sugar (pentulose or hexulose) kinase
MLRRLSSKLVLDDPKKPLLQPICLMDGTYLIGSALNSAALNLQWFKETVGEEACLAVLPDTKHVAPGSNGLLYLPYLTGERDPSIGEHGTAGFVGIRPQHKLPDMIRAMIEGVSFRFGMLADALQRGGIGFDAVRVGGGGILHFPIWSEVLSAILDAKVQISPADEPALVGNAMLGFLACGTFKDMDAAMAAMVPPDTESITAPAETTAAYQALKPKFTKLSTHLSEIFPDLAP